MYGQNVDPQPSGGGGGGRTTPPTPPGYGPVLGCSPPPHTANTRRWPNVGLMLGQRRRRWASISPTVGQRIVFAGLSNNDISVVTKCTVHKNGRTWENTANTYTLILLCVRCDIDIQ